MTVFDLLTGIDSSASISPPIAEISPPTKTPTNTKDKTVPPMIMAKEDPTKEDRTFFKKDMSVGYFG
jgi:hypothetical protein